jgi:predicted acylesterase/phospholipase RssA
MSATSATITTMEYVCFGVGGANGWVFVGVLTALEREYARHGLPLYHNLKGASGASVGSFLALATILKYGAVEFREFAKRCMIKYKKRLTEYNLLDLRTTKGLVSTSVIGDAVRDMIEQKLGDHHRDITLRELHALTGLHYVAASHNLSNERGELLDHLSAPDLAVCKAVQMSSAMPGVFQIVEHAGCVYTDSALSNALPYEAFDLNRTLAFNVIAHHSHVRPEDMTVSDFCCRIASIYNATTEVKIAALPEHHKKRVLTLHVPCLSQNAARGFALTDAQRDRLINFGLIAGLTLFNYPTAVVAHAAMLYFTVMTSVREARDDPTVASCESIAD